MSKSRKRLRKAILGAAALYGASKLKGIMDAKAMQESVTADQGHGLIKNKDYGPYKKTPIKKAIKKKFPRLKVDEIGNVTKDGKEIGVGNPKTKFINLKADSKYPVGIYQDGKKVSDLNPKAINVLSDGKISTGGKLYENKEAYKKAMKIKRGETRTTGGMKEFFNKNILGERTQLKKKGGILKARGGVEVNTKLNGKLYTQTF